MWIEWPEGLINLDHAKLIEISENTYQQWIVKIYIDSNGPIFSSCKYFESENNAKEEFEKLKNILIKNESFTPSYTQKV